MSLSVRLSDLLLGFKELGSSRYTDGLEGGGDSEADDLICPAFVRNYKVGIERIETTLGAYDRSAEAFEVNSNIGLIGHAITPFVENVL